MILSGEAILSAENSEKSLGGQGFALNHTGELTALPQTSDGGLRPSVLGQDRYETKKSVLILVLVLQVLCCVVKYNLVTLVVTMILKDTTTCQALYIVSPLWSWNITTVEINSGVHLLRS